MRISRIRVNNFKSLVDFDLPMEKFILAAPASSSQRSIPRRVARRCAQSSQRWR